MARDVSVDFDTRAFARVVNVLESEFGKDASHIANKILAGICFQAIKRTRKANPSEITRALNAPIRTSKISGRQRTLKLKHVIAIAILRKGKTKRDRFPEWGEITDLADRMLRRRRSAAGFLRYGWLYAGANLKRETGQYRVDGQGSRTLERARSRSLGGKQWSGYKPARGRGGLAEAVNYAATVVAGHGDEASRYEGFGNKGLQEAMRAQLAIEERSLGKALQRRANRLAN